MPAPSGVFSWLCRTGNNAQAEDSVRGSISAALPQNRPQPAHPYSFLSILTSVAGVMIEFGQLTGKERVSRKFCDEVPKLGAGQFRVFFTQGSQGQQDFSQKVSGNGRLWRRSGVAGCPRGCRRGSR